jgi:uncharacterized protein (TIGR02145 family)
MNNNRLLSFACASFAFILASAMLDACSSARNMSSDSSAAIPTTVPESHSSAAIPDGACAACIADTACIEQSRSEQRRSMPESDSSAVIPDPVPGSASAGFSRDIRDGQVYKIVTIGDQVWMVKNLNYEMAGSYCYSNNASNCMRYGRLYTWNAAMNACPDGWHLPTYDELVSLIENASGQFLAGGVLKSRDGWKRCRQCDVADDMYSFSAFPTGIMNEDGSFDKIFEYGFLWSATETESNQIPYMGFSNISSVAMLLLGNKNKGLSVRCVKGKSPKSDGPVKMNDLDRPEIKFYDLPLTANTPTLNDGKSKIWLDEL